jgi:hypothetical protein
MKCCVLAMIMKFFLVVGWMMTLISAIAHRDDHKSIVGNVRRLLWFYMIAFC